MAKLAWDAVGDRLYETGIKNGVLYLQNGGSYSTGVVWNGLTGFSESPDGGDANDIYADNIKYLSIRSRENFKGTITAYSCPEEFKLCDGTSSPISGLSFGQQSRKSFGMAYTTSIGNDLQFEDYGYKIHLIYGATASPSSKDYKTINDSPEAIEFSWEINTVPTNMTGFKPVAHIEIDTTKLSSFQLKNLEDTLYGTENTDPILPLPDALINLLSRNEITGNPVIFYNDGITTIENFTVHLYPKQSGSGDPGPHNSRSFDMHTSVIVNVTNGNQANEETYTIAMPSNAVELGDTCCGELDITDGKYKRQNWESSFDDFMHSNIWSYHGEGTKNFYILNTPITPTPPGIDMSRIDYIRCESFNYFGCLTLEEAYAQLPDGNFAFIPNENANLYIVMRMDDGLPDANFIPDYHGHWQISYPYIGTYTEYSFTPVNIQPLIGNNTISCDSGDITVKF